MASAGYHEVLTLPFVLEEAAITLASSDLFIGKAKLVAEPTYKNRPG